MSYIGDIRLGDTIDFKFCTVQSTGAPTTLAGSPVISAYPANSTTQLTAGITLSVDFDSVTGLNNVRVVASGGNGYLTATNYEMVITTGTVNSVSVVGYVVGTFSIENRSAVMPTTAARTLDVSATGEAGVDWANVGSPTTTLGLTGTTISTAQVAASVTAAVTISAGTGAGQLDFTSGVVKASLAQVLGTAFTEGAAGRIAAAFKQFFNIATPAATMDHGVLVDTVTTYTGNTPQTGDGYARLGAPAGASVSADVAAVKSDTAAIKTSTNTGVAPGAASGIAIVGSNMGSASSVTGAVGSVTGAVGSVTGNVGGNVVGSVASVTAAVAITSNIKKNQALAKFQFLMTDSTNHNPATGKTVTCTRSIDGGAFGAGTLANVTEVSNGTYTVDFGAGDLNGNVIVLRATATGSDDTFERIITQS